jgi:SAM-dependent methyltransferase
MSSLEKYRDPNPVVRFLLRRFFETVRCAAGESGASSWLDVGCGEGEALRRGVFRAGATRVHLDLLGEPLAHLRGAFPGSNLVRGSALALPFAAKSFDAVLCLEVLEHLEHPGLALRELARVARRRVILSVPWEPWFRAGNLVRGRYARGWGNYPEHVQHWNGRSLREFLLGLTPDVQVTGAWPWLVASCDPTRD